MKVRHILLGAVAAVPALCSAANIDRSTLTEVVNSVRIIEPASKKSTAAQVKAEFFAPNVLRTGADSRAEMIAPDQTVTRVGQNTVFSFARDSREVELQQGSILFQSPSGKGGGTIRTPAASAAVLGTTLIVTATKNGGFKVLLVEGRGKVSGAGGAVRNLNAGEMVYALPGGKLSGVFEFRLSQQVGASALIRGFKTKLPSVGKIQAAISKQEKDIASGKALDTGLLASGSPSIAYKIDVAHDTIVQQQAAANGTATVTRFQNAATTDAIVDTPTLDAARVFDAESTDVLEFPGDSSPFLLGDSAEVGLVQRSTNAAQFVGANILFDTPSLSLGDYAGRDVVQFLALKDVLLNQSIDLGTFGGEIQFWAGGTIQGPLGTPITVSAAAKQLTLAAFGDEFSTTEALPTELRQLSIKTPLQLTAFTAENTDGGLAILGGDVRLLGTHLAAQTDLHLLASHDLLVMGTQAGPVPADLSGGSFGLPAQAAIIKGGSSASLAAGNDLTVVGAGIQAKQVRLTAGGDLKLSVVQLSDGTPGNLNSSPGNLVFTKPNIILTSARMIDLRNVNFQSNDIMLQARTIKLANVDFRLNSRVVLESQVGRLAPQPNSGRPAVPGFVNFIRNVNYGGSPAESAVIQNGPGNSGSGAGIIIRPRK